MNVLRAPDSARRRSEPSAASPAVDPRPRVLVVEDDGDLREVLCELLAADGWVAVGARDGAEALSVLRSGAPLPAFVLLDLVMQGMNGWEFRAEQLRDPALAAVQVIAMSASHELAGVPTLKKPFEVRDLRELVRATTARRLAAAREQASTSVA